MSVSDPREVIANDSPVLVIKVLLLTKGRPNSVGSVELKKWSASGFSFALQVADLVWIYRKSFGYRNP